MAADAAADGGFCALHEHAFCRDFDEGDAGTGWQSVDVTPGVTFALNASHAVSAPFALLTAVPHATSSQTLSARASSPRFQPRRRG
jgi:hypothetical protein